MNIFFNLETGTRIRLYRNLWLTNGIGFSHLSNANLKEPNFGLNDITFFAGLDWVPDNRMNRSARRSRKPKRKPVTVLPFRERPNIAVFPR